ncbi:MAG: penicillin-binding protein 2 [Anaerolineaceae bacterium]|nr:penicillin-binding protein 2 [Anaerolineaceae bacterium]
MSEMRKENLSSSRMRFLYIILGAIFLFYMIRLFSLQIIEGPDYLALAEENRISNISVATQRGVIYDRNGYVLARNIPSFNIAITPANLPDDEAATQEVYRQLSEVINVSVNQGDLEDELAVKTFKPCDNEFGIEEIVFIADTNWPYNPTSIVCNVSREMALIVMEKANDWPGVSVEVEPVRDYPTGWLTSEVIGFLGPIYEEVADEYESAGFSIGTDKIGFAGVEDSMNDELMGTNGLRVVEVDVGGRIISDLEPPVDPVPGNNVKLTIDTRLQVATKYALVTEMQGWNAYLNEERMTVGVAIAMNPKTGEILSLVSHPTYENNRMARLIPAYYYQQLLEDVRKPLFNHAISAEYPPGSVYKLAAAVGALNEGVVELNETLDCPEEGQITVIQKYSANEVGTPFEYVCWQDTGHGKVDWRHAISLSCDVYFYKISGGFEDEVKQGLGVYRMKEYAEALGYGEESGIELYGEMTGLVPDPQWKRINAGEIWATGDTYIASMGQGYVLSTPMQVLVSFATLANDGKMMQPTLIHEILDADGDVIKPFEERLKQDITEEPLIEIYDEDNQPTGEFRTIDPFVIEMAKEGMRMTVMDGGTIHKEFAEFDLEIQSAGKTGTAEYCDDIANEKGLCQRGSWPTHAWYVGYAPYDDPEIVVVAFVYNGGEGASVAGPVVRKVMEAYFELKEIDNAVPGS